MAPPMFRGRAIFQALEVSVSDWDATSVRPTTLVRRLAVLVKVSDEATPLAPVVSLLSYPPLCAGPTHPRRGTAIGGALFLLTGGPSNDSSSWAHVWGVLGEHPGAIVSSCEGETLLERVLDPCGSLSHVHSLVKEGGDASTDLAARSLPLTSLLPGRSHQPWRSRALSPAPVYSPRRRGASSSLGGSFLRCGRVAGDIIPQGDRSPPRFRRP
jgi:hypothetical protein